MIYPGRVDEGFPVPKGLKFLQSVNNLTRDMPANVEMMAFCWCEPGEVRNFFCSQKKNIDNGIREPYNMDYKDRIAEIIKGME